MKILSRMLTSRIRTALGLAGFLAVQGMIFDTGDANAANFASKADYYKQSGTVSVKANGISGSDLALAVTMDTDGDDATCGTDTALTVNVGDAIDFCYTVTNNSTTDLAYSTLDDSVDGNIFTNQATAIAAGGTYTYHRTVVATASATHDATWTAQDLLPGYTPDDTAAAAFVDISTTGTALGLGDDDEIGITIPFQFSFYGASSDQLCIGNNGAIVFGVSTCAVGFSNTALPATGFGGAAIMPFWDDFFIGSGDVYWQADGTSPNQRVIVQWDRPHYISGNPTPSNAILEAIFNEDGSISFQYQSTNFGDPQFDNGISATIGLQNADASIANQYSFNTALAHPAPSAISWTSGTATILTANASTSLDVGAPVIGVDPTSISEAAPTGSSTPVTTDLTISNTGDRDLDWNIGEAPSSRAHFPSTPRHFAHKVDPSASAKADPNYAEARAKYSTQARRSGFGLLGTTGIPAYSFTGFSHQDYVSLDLLVPGTLNSILDPQPANIYAASFVDNDFSTEYVIDDGGNFGTVDTATGAFTSIGPVTGGSASTYLSLRWDATTGNLYALGDDPAIYTIDTATGAATLVANISGDISPDALLVNLAISPDGLMYSIDIADDVLVAIDKNTGAASVIGPTGINANFAQGMDFDPTTGVLYWAGYQGGGVSSVYTVDLTSGTATEIGPVADGAELFGLAIAIAGGGCAQPEDVPWLSVSPDSGTVAPAGTGTATVTLDPTGLTDGVYTANVCVSSNDPAHRNIAVPVEFTVGDDIHPAATIDPASLEFSLEPGASGSDTVTVSNTGSPGTTLTFDVTEAEADCSTPADVPWLSVTPTSGSVPVGTPASLEVAVDTASLDPGSYTANLCVASNDTANPTIAVPVTLTVLPTDLIFKDGFDGAPVGGIFDSRDEFLTHVATGYYENAFDDVTTGPSDPLSYSQGGFEYTISTQDGALSGLYNDVGVISTDQASDKIYITFTTPVTAVGGNFWATDISVQPTGTSVVLTFSDGTEETVDVTDASTFRGLTSATPITSLTFDAPDAGTSGPFYWATLDNLIVGNAQ